MKSLFAVLALAVALGVGYWKYSNPDAGVADLGTQASSSLGAVSSLFAGRNNNDAQLTQALARSDDLQAELYETRSVLDENIAELADTRALLDQQQQSLQDQKALTDTYDKKFIELENTLSSLSNRADAEQQSLVSLGQEVTQLSGQLDDNNASRQQTVDRKIDALDLQVQTLVADSEQSNTRLNSQFENLNATVSRSSSELQADYEQRLESLAAALTDEQEEKLTATTIALREERQIAIDNTERNLTQNFNGLQNQFSTLSAITGDASSALELTSSLDDRLASLEDSIAEIDNNPAIARLKRDVQSGQDQLGEQVEERLARLETQVQQDQASMNDQLSGRISTLQTTLQASTAGENDRIKEQLDAARKKIAVLESKTAELDANAGRIETLELAAAKPADPRQDEIDNKLVVLETSMQGLNTEVSEINTRLSSLSSAQADRQSIELSQAELQDRLASLDQSVEGDGNSPDLKGILEELAQSRSRIEQLESRVASLPESSAQTAEAKENQEQLLSKLDFVRKKVSELEQRQIAAPAAALAKVDDVEVKAKANEYKIYFDSDSSTISKDAQKVLSSFIAQEKNRANSISIFGFTDRSGNAAYNQRLALRRANRVRSFLIQQGIDFRKINAVDGLGEDLAASNDADGGDGDKNANQRTVVLYAYQE